jgi:hypothetical protein
MDKGPNEAELKLKKLGKHLRSGLVRKAGHSSIFFVETEIIKQTARDTGKTIAEVMEDYKKKRVLSDPKTTPKKQPSSH